jgi:hypothetical protein
VDYYPTVPEAPHVSVCHTLTSLFLARLAPAGSEL